MRKRTLHDSYKFPGFIPQRTVVGIFGDPYARVIKLTRRGKKHPVAFAARFIELFTITRSKEFVIFPAVMSASIWNCLFGGSRVGGAAR